MCIELVMSSNHLILCHPLLLLPSIFPSIRVFSDELVLYIRWPTCWTFSFSINPSNKYSRLVGSPCSPRDSHQRIDAFELWCWRRLLRVPWTARRSNYSILQESRLEYSLEGLMLKLQNIRQGEEQVQKQNWTQAWHFLETEKSERHLDDKNCDVDGARQTSCGDLMKASYQCRGEEILIGRLYILFL